MLHVTTDTRSIVFAFLQCSVFKTQVLAAKKDQINIFLFCSALGKRATCGWPVKTALAHEVTCKC